MQRVVGLPEQMPMRQAAGHRPVVPRARAARGLPGQLPARGAPRGARRAVQRSPQPQGLLQPGGHVVGVLRARLRDPGVDRARPDGTPGHARGDRGPEPGPAARLPGDDVPARPVPPYVDVPAAGGARRPGLPPVRRSQDRARQPDRPLRGGRDRGRLPAPEGPADRVRELDRPLEVPDPGARAPPGDPAAVDGPALGPVPAGLELRRRRVVVRGGEVPEHLRVADPDVGLVRLHRHRQRPRRRTGLRPGGQVRQPLPGASRPGSPTGCS